MSGRIIEDLSLIGRHEVTRDGGHDNLIDDITDCINWPEEGDKYTAIRYASTIGFAALTEQGAQSILAFYPSEEGLPKELDANAARQGEVTLYNTVEAAMSDESRPDRMGAYSVRFDRKATLLDERTDYLDNWAVGAAAMRTIRDLSQKVAPYSYLGRNVTIEPDMLLSSLNLTGLLRQTWRQRMGWPSVAGLADSKLRVTTKGLRNYAPQLIGEVHVVRPGS